MLSQLEELKKVRSEQQTLKDDHEVEIHQYIDATTLEGMKVKDYQKDLWQVMKDLK